MKLGTPSLYPCLWFDREAREAAEFYCSVFPDARIIASSIVPDTPSGDVEIVDFELAGRRFQAFSAGPLFRFSEAISFVIGCDTQQEIDYYTEALSAVPEAEQCGWVKDRYGLSWQIVPNVMEEMMRCGDRERLRRVTKAFLQMKRFDIAALEAAYRGA